MFGYIAIFGGAVMAPPSSTSSDALLESVHDDLFFEDEVVVFGIDSRHTRFCHDFVEDTTFLVVGIPL